MTEQLGLFDDRSSRTHDVAQAPLRVRESKRARSLTLRLLPPHTLELVVPRGTRPAKVAAFVAEHRRWIERARREIATRYRASDDRLPARLTLAAVDQAWVVRYRHTPNLRPECRAVDDRLEVRARDAELADAPGLLRGWLLRHAKALLSPWLIDVAAPLGRQPKAVQVRLQRTRWGSCSGSGVISLNAALLFLDPALVRYLFVHELCHLHSLNHSRRFWSLVERFEPNYRTLDRQLTEAWTLIPFWVHVR